MGELRRAELLALLGYDEGFPGTPALVEVETSSARREADGLRVGQVRLVSGARVIPALLLEPDAPVPRGGRPGILYCHAHGNRYDIGKSEVTDGRPALRDPPLGVALARAGYVVLCADMPGFGERQAEGTESELAKAALWRGRSLLGDMLADQALAHRALCALDTVDATRTAALGISMGATLAYFIAALTPELACAAHLCAFADMAPLIEAGAHDLHGIYMVVPGLLKRRDLSDVAAMIAPRPQLVCTGLRDPLTSESAFRPALRRLQKAYDAAGVSRALRCVTEQDGGHAETIGFRTAVLAFLAEHLSGPSRASPEGA